MRKHLPLIGICLGYFMVILDATAVNVALPDLGRELRGDVAGLQWVVDAYTLVFAALLLSGGALGDRLGSRRVFLAGLGLFTVASAACAAAPTVGFLVGARVAQGIGAALLVPSSLAVLRATYADAAERARAVGVWAAVAGIAAASGPIIGGLLVTSVSWRAVFVLNVPVGAVALLLAARCVAPDGARRGGGFDPAGQVAGILALACLTFGLIEGGDAGWGSAVPLLALALSVVAFAVFLAIERRAAAPMLPLELFRSRVFSASAFVGAAINFGFYGQLFVISLYFQQVRGYSALATGLAMLPEGLFVSVASALAGRLTARVGPRVPMLIGLTTGGLGLVGLVVAGPETPYPVLIAPLAAAGFGIAVTMPAATAAIIEAAPAHHAGIAAGVLNASRQAGGTLGVAVLGTLIAGASFIGGLQAAMAVAGGAFFAAAVVVAVAVRCPRAEAECAVEGRDALRMLTALRRAG
jgi:DHA2 family methylenomycin A resistance protein-like MFS transporter